MINYFKMWGERMRNVYGTYQNVNRVSETFSVKIFRADPYIYTCNNILIAICMYCIWM
jgi:hypothetical protein